MQLSYYHRALAEADTIFLYTLLYRDNLCCLISNELNITLGQKTMRIFLEILLKGVRMDIDKIREMK